MAVPAASVSSPSASRMICTTGLSMGRFIVSTTKPVCPLLELLSIPLRVKNG
jgi:hypothetical protein